MSLQQILIYSLIFLLTACNNIDFDSKKWKSWKEIELDSSRWDMVDDIIDNFKGKSVKEVEELLGEGPINCPNGNCSTHYILGPCRSGINYGGLTIYFKNGKASNLKKLVINNVNFIIRQLAISSIKKLVSLSQILP